MQRPFIEPMPLFNEMHELLDELAKTLDIMCPDYAIDCVPGE
jgi:hypothetical protein